ncbi:glucoamylase family protein [Nonomuraea sp. NPDC050328]|uniref:glucoamylase family protein n=1 Tax=Nonomuraea sp. NPDC050328 TaxID=3364361 RepID=UPI0037AA2618
MRRFLTATVLTVLTAVLLATGLSGTAAAVPARLPDADRAVLTQYAADTWKSLEALVAPETGLPASYVNADLTVRSHQTGPTPFGGYLWSATTAWRVGLIGRRAARERVERTLDALGRLDYHRPTGMFYRWYDPYTGGLKDATPASTFLSSVDNAWTAVGLMVVRNAFPELRGKISPLLDRMDFRAFWQDGAKGANEGGGLMRGGIWPVPPGDATCTEKVNGVDYTCHFYGALGETRMVTYVAVALGQVPGAKAYYGQNRTLAPDDCGQEQKPVGRYRTYGGVKVWEGAYTYRGMRLVPNWNGSMFEAMMPNLFVPEERWGPRSWGVNHPLWVRAQIEHGLDEAGYGYWGFSPSNNPAGGYRAYGVDAIGMGADGAYSDQDRTPVDTGFEGCRPAQPEPVRFGDGTVTPHASFLALRYAPREALDNLARLKRDFDVYGPGGFYDSVSVKSGQVAKEYLTLDQSMVMAALGNALAGDHLRDYWSLGRPAARIRPLLAAEEFSAAPREQGWSADEVTLRRYAADTWRSLDAMVEPATGLPADNIGGDLAPATRNKSTSPTNIGLYLWSVAVARDTGMISEADAVARAGKVLATLATLAHHQGMYYNWYNPADGQVAQKYPFLSSVDNGWLAAGLMVARNAFPGLRDQAQALLSRMDFRLYYDPAAKPGTGLLRGGAYPAKPDDGRCVVEGQGVWYTCNHYAGLGETRIAAYVGISLGQLPAELYFGPWRSLPDTTCGQEQKPVGSYRTHLGLQVWTGTYGYRGMRLVPNAGGSMFEALMTTLVVPEEEWGAKSWGRNHPVFVKAQIEHGLTEAGYGYWGFSPANNPAGGYRAYGVDEIGFSTGGYFSDQQNTAVDVGFEGCRPAQPRPATWGDGVVTPHAAALAYRYAPREALDNLAKLRRNLDSYGPGGFYDAIAVKSGQVSKRYLSLDQGMFLAAAGNALTGDKLRAYFTAGEAETKLKPVMGLEEWESHP